MTSNPLDDLQRWYAKQCNGAWEHGHGVEIGTLDNPGWTVTVDLSGTALEHRDFQDLELHRTENDWVSGRIRDDRCDGRGGPENLTEVLRIFVEWSAG